MKLVKNIHRFIISFKPRQLSWSDKKLLVQFLFEHDNSLNKLEIKAIYKEPSYRADGYYFEEIKNILETNQYFKM